MKNEILYINSYLQKYNIHLPVPETRINKTKNASFDVEELRFEVDESGSIWKILSQSIYTDEFDFVRELLQNSIDATLLPIYLDKTKKIEYASPRSWDIDNKIYIGYSETNKELHVIDNGIGMDSTSLKKFLFKVTGSGYSDYSDRPFRYPSIAKFGIGFVSCLINADNIEIFTRKQNSEFMHNVTLKANSNLAILQKLSAQDFQGTAIKLKLKHELTYERLSNYIKDKFVYPSVQIIIINIDDFMKLAEKLLYDINLSNNLILSYELVNYLNHYEVERNKLLKPINSYSSILNNIDSQLSYLIEWLEENKEYDKNYSDTEKYKYFKNALKSIRKSIAQTSNIPSFALQDEKISIKELFNNIGYYLYELKKYEKQIYNIIQKNNEKKSLYPKCFEEINLKEVSFYAEWQYCIIEFNSDFDIQDIFFDEPIDFTDKTGIIFIRHNFKNFNDGYEYSATTGFLFSKGEICNSISKLTGYYYRRISNQKYNGSIFISGLDEAYDFDDIIRNVEEDYDEIDGFSVDNRFSFVICKNNNFHFFNDVIKDEIDYLDYKSDNNTFLSLNITKYIANNPKSEESIIELSSLQSIIHDKNNFLCQDGIKLEEKLDSLFPIGVFKICCNLTATSRMNLNITRHKTSEIKNEIMPWVENTALSIQNNILTNTNKILSKLQLEFEYKELLSENNNSDLLSDLLWQQFKNKFCRS